MKVFKTGIPGIAVQVNTVGNINVLFNIRLVNYVYCINDANITVDTCIDNIRKAYIVRAKMLDVYKHTGGYKGWVIGRRITMRYDDALEYSDCWANVKDNLNVEILNKLLEYRNDKVNRVTI